MNYWIIPGTVINDSPPIPELDNLDIKIHTPDTSRPGRKVGVTYDDCLRRHAVSYLLRTKAKWSYKKIANFLGCKDHSVPWVSTKRFKGYLELEDAKAVALVNELRVKMFHCI